MYKDAQRADIGLPPFKALTNYCWKWEGGLHLTFGGMVRDGISVLESFNNFYIENHAFSMLYRRCTLCESYIFSFAQRCFSAEMPTSRTGLQAADLFTTFVARFSEKNTKCLHMFLHIWVARVESNLLYTISGIHLTGQVESKIVTCGQLHVLVLLTLAPCGTIQPNQMQLGRREKTSNRGSFQSCEQAQPVEDNNQ